MAKKQSNQDTTPQVRNKKAYHDFELIEKVEAGMSLVGSEVKSLRNRGGDLDGAYARVTDGEVWLVGAKIAPYAQASQFNHDPNRPRKLLLRKSQIHRIQSKLAQRGLTLVPLRIYFNDRGLAKCEIALARGRRQYDKRQKIQAQEQKKDVARSLKKYRS